MWPTNGSDDEAKNGDNQADWCRIDTVEQSGSIELVNLFEIFDSVWPPVAAHHLPLPEQKKQ